MTKLQKQFGKPQGILGSVAGFIMANRSSNLDRIAWGINLLDIKPADNKPFCSLFGSALKNYQIGD